MSLLLILNISHTFFWCFHYWLWTSRHHLWVSAPTRSNFSAFVVMLEARQNGATKAVVCKCSSKSVFLKNGRPCFCNIHRKTLHVLESLFNKAAGHKACNFIKKRLQHRCFPVNTAKKNLRIACLIDQLQWLLLELIKTV